MIASIGLPRDENAPCIYPLFETKEVEEDRKGLNLHLVAAIQDKFVPLAPPNIRKLQREDEDFKDLIEYLEAGVMPSDPARRTKVSTEAKKACLQDGLLYYTHNSKKPLDLTFLLRLAVPKPLRAEVMEACHDDVFAAHLGRDKTYERVATRFHWPGIYEDTMQYVQQCHLCNSRKGPKLQPHVNLHSTPIGTTPWERVQADFIGPIHPSYEGHKYILAFIDLTTKFTELIACEQATAEVVAKAFMSQVVLRHGAPYTLYTDGGKQFLSDVMERICKLSNTRKLQTTYYAPWSNGNVERNNSNIIQMLSMYIDAKQSDWHLFLPYVQFAYNTAVHRSTGFSPAQLNYARSLRTPFDASLPRPKIMDTVYTDDYARLAQRWLTEAQKAAEVAIEKAQKQQAKDFDKKVTPIEFRVGQQVYIYTPVLKTGLSPKFFHNFHGPYTVVAVKKPLVKVVHSDPPKRKDKGPFWIHSTRVKITHLDDKEVILDAKGEPVFSKYGTQKGSEVEKRRDPSPDDSTQAVKDSESVGDADTEHASSQKRERNVRSKKRRPGLVTTAPRRHNLRKNPKRAKVPDGFVRISNQ